MSRTKCYTCGSSDGLAEYENSTYCFSCHTTTKSNSLIKAEKKVLKLPIQQFKNRFPMNEKLWLMKYGISQDMIQRHNVFWSSYYNRVCFPFYKNGIITSCWMRSVNSKVRAKWLFVGDKNHKNWTITSTEYPGDTLILAEDILSAIKINSATNIDCLFLGGTNVKFPLPNWTKFGKLLVWLDGDSAGKQAAKKIIKQSGLFFSFSKNIHTKQDPKCYKNYEILETVLMAIKENE